jgi:hypothetical protein
MYDSITFTFGILTEQWIHGSGEPNGTLQNSYFYNIMASSTVWTLSAAVCDWQPTSGTRGNVFRNRNAEIVRLVRITRETMYV